VLYTLPNKTHSDDYYKYITDFTGLERFDNNCYVTEFMPITKEHWTKLKKQIESIYNKPWLLAMFDQFEEDSKTRDQIWFSEYELLANWMLHQDSSIQTIVQRRLEILMRYSYNCVCFKD
jgi:hypothetical protein